MSDEDEYGGELGDCLEWLIQEGTIVNPAEVGIAKQVAGKGLDSLSDLQQSIYDSKIRPQLEIECVRCGSPVPGSEVLYALQEGDKLCSYCRHMSSKDD